MVKKLLLALMLLATCSCMTMPSGQKKIAGVIPVPSFMGGGEVTPQQATYSQFQPYHWMAVAMIGFGIVFVVYSKARSGLGVGCVLGGLGLSVWATVMPRIAGAVSLVLVIGLVGACGYLLYTKFKTEKV